MADRETLRQAVGGLIADAPVLFGVQRAEVDALTALLTHEAAQHAELTRLRAALRGLQRAPGCWCDHGIGHPLVTTHSPACREMRAALNGEDHA